MSWNRNEEGKRDQGSGIRDQGLGNGRLKGLVAGVIVVVGAAVAAWWLWPDAPAPVAEDGDGTVRRIREVKPAVVTNAAVAVTNAAPVNDPRFPYTDGRKVISSVTNNFDQIIDMCIMPNGRTRKVVRRAKPPTFQTIADQVIAAAVSGPGDVALPPMPIPDDIEESFVAAMKKPIVINDDDPERVKEAKRKVIEARAYIDEQMKTGRGFREILNEHLAQCRENEKSREMVMRTAAELRESGDPELLNQYLEKANAVLRDSGAREVEAVPRNVRREAGERRLNNGN